MEAPLESRKIEIEQETLNHLNTTRKWAMFLAIIGFIFLGLIIIIGLIAGTFLTAFSSGEKGLGIPESFMFIPILLIALVYFFPVLFLFRFSKHSSHAIQHLDKLELNKAIKYLKYYFVYTGVLIIIIFSLYIVVLVVAGSSMAFLKGL
jgi:magnesium-transporting ATPase (P-type)